LGLGATTDGTGGRGGDFERPSLSKGKQEESGEGGEQIEGVKEAIIFVARIGLAYRFQAICVSGERKMGLGVEVRKRKREEITGTRERWGFDKKGSNRFRNAFDSHEEEKGVSVERRN